MTEVRRETIATLTHGTYLVAEPEEGARAAVVGFHGYGETAAEHLEALRRIPGSEGWLLCSVQALHPFYKRNGDVVACWMTSFDRGNAIADNVRYVAAVVEALKRCHPGVERLAYVGFSQGVAMAYRAAAFAGHTSHALVALAGDVPPDVAAAELPAFPAVLIGRGSEETWYTEDQLTRDLQTLQEHGIEAEAAHFDGGHEWTEDFLARAGVFLSERLRE
jgi:predicted esterase